MRSSDFPPIADYALIGDSRSAALVTRTGAIEWLCWPRFESPAIFSALLDRERGGSWRISPSSPATHSRGYLPDTNVLVTEFRTAHGAARVTDFMAVTSEREKRHLLLAEHELIRVVEGVEGEVELTSAFAPQLDYGLRRAPVRLRKNLGVRVEDGQLLYTLCAEPELQLGGDGVVRATFRVRKGDTAAFALCFDCEAPAVLFDARAGWRPALERTVRYWRGWAAKARYQGPFRDSVVRSALALKLLAFAPSGAIAAAPTTSLPERIGGSMNWDYRYCWLRDAGLTVRALFQLGYSDEAEAFVSWMLHSTRLTRPELCVLYDVYGRPPKAEEQLPELSGYRDSRPVRIRNAAATQLQLDVYGEVIEGATQLVRKGLRLDRETSGMLADFGNFVCEHWQQPDQGIWEPREPPAHHTHSKVLCWVAFDRLLELRQLGYLPRLPVDRIERHMKALRAEIEARAFSEALQSYTARFDGATVDASLLLLGNHGYLRPSHPRLRGTFSLIQSRLGAPGGFLFRNEEFKRVGEGAFGICGFWACEFLARGGGTLAEAEERLASLCSSGNDVGLFAEEVDPVSGEALGNFPQAFTHLGLISAAIAIEERRARERRPTDEPPRRVAAAEEMRT